MDSTRGQLIGNEIDLGNGFACTEYGTGPKETPVVSVAMITYNHVSYIAQAIEGALGQKTDFPFEILLHDDASTDGTADICMEYAEKYPEIIRYVPQAENQYSQGICVGVTFQYPRCRGKYLAFCEGDDYWTNSHKLQTQHDFLTARPDYYLVAGRTDICQDGDIFSREFRWNPRRVDFTVEDYICNPLFHTSSIFVRAPKGDFPSVEKKEGNPQVLQGDQYIVLHLAKPGCDRIRVIDTVMSVYRRHAGGITLRSSQRDKRRAMDSLLFILREFNEYTSEAYSRAVNYRVREIRALLSIYEARGITKIGRLLRHIRTVAKYILRVRFGIRPF